MRGKFIKSALTLGIAFLALLLWEQIVLNQRQGNLVAKWAEIRMDEGQRSAAERRETVETLESLPPMDPYIRGLLDVLEARGWVALEAPERARRKYEEALDQRVLPEVIVEAALYQWRAGDLDRSKNLLMKANRFSPTLIRGVPGPALPAEID